MDKFNEVRQTVKPNYNVYKRYNDSATVASKLIQFTQINGSLATYVGLLETADTRISRTLKKYIFVTYVIHGMQKHDVIPKLEVHNVWQQRYGQQLADVRITALITFGNSKLKNAA